MLDQTQTPPVSGDQPAAPVSEPTPPAAPVGGSEEPTPPAAEPVITPPANNGDAKGIGDTNTPTGDTVSTPSPATNVPGDNDAGGTPPAAPAV